MIGCRIPLGKEQNKQWNWAQFSIGLAVADLETSKTFYEKLGFTVFGGEATQNWLIMKNGDHVVGLFQGMFERNILTFNPGWDNNAQELESLTSIRVLQRELKDRGWPLRARQMKARLVPPALWS